MFDHEATPMEEQMRLMEARMEARIEALVEARVDARLGALETAASAARASAIPVAKDRRSRRDLMKLAGAAVVGVAGAAYAGGLAPLSAAAADGANLVLGAAASNKEESGTYLYSDSLTNAMTVLTLDGVFYTGSQRVDGLVVRAQSGGIAGNFETIGGPDIAAMGTGRFVQASGVLAGSAPNWTPANQQLESIRGGDGSFWQSRAHLGTALGTLKTAWKRINTVRVDSAAGDGTAFIPARIIDTRNGTGGVTGPLAANSTTTWASFTGTNGLPSDAVGIIGNITAIGFSGAGFATIFPAGVGTPGVSSLNFGGTQYAFSNAITVGFGTGANTGQISVFISNNVPTHIVVDVFAYIQ